VVNLIYPASWILLKKHAVIIHYIFLLVVYGQVVGLPNNSYKPYSYPTNPYFTKLAS
jgi:hypothetical protein